MFKGASVAVSTLAQSEEFTGDVCCVCAAELAGSLLINAEQGLRERTLVVRRASRHVVTARGHSRMLDVSVVMLPIPVHTVGSWRNRHRLKVGLWRGLC